MPPKALRFLLGIIACLAFAAGAYFWAMGMMDSIYVYRSPLHDNPPVPGEPLGESLTRRVVFVLVDALREDTALEPEVMPFLNKLRESGAWASMHSRPPSYSAPGYSVLFTGAWPELSDGPAMNLEYEDLYPWTQDNLASAFQRAGLKSGISAFKWFEKLIPEESVAVGFYTVGENQFADRDVVDAALPWLSEGDYQFVFIHLDQVDYAGHYEGGPIDPRWDAAARRVDDLLREIAATLDLTQDTLFVCSDHGQIDQGGHGGQDAVVLLEPFVLVGAGVVPGEYGDVQMVDVAPTLAALLGANIPASSQGQVLTQMLTFSPEQVQFIESALESQQSQLMDAYQKAIGIQVDVKDDESPVAKYQGALESARGMRLKTERVQRIVLGVGVFLLTVIILYLKRSSDLLWLIGGGVLYLVVFHLRYALLDGRAYSLSSVYSADTLIAYCGTTALIALFIAWLVSSLGLKAFRRGSGEASWLTLELTIITIFLLALPVLWYVMFNGVLVTWTLPDQASMFLAFIAILQILVVSISGLILTGLSALIARYANL